MSAKPQPQDHFAAAFDFAIKYLAEEVHPETDAHVSVSVDSSGKLSKWKTSVVSLNVAALIHEMHLARGVLDEKKSSGEELAEEHSAFVTAIDSHMNTAGYLMDSAVYEAVESFDGER